MRREKMHIKEGGRIPVEDLQEYYASPFYQQFLIKLHDVPESSDYVKSHNFLIFALNLTSIRRGGDLGNFTIPEFEAHFVVGNTVTMEVSKHKVY